MCIVGNEKAATKGDDKVNIMLIFIKSIFYNRFDNMQN